MLVRALPAHSIPPRLAAVPFTVQQPKRKLLRVLAALACQVRICCDLQLLRGKESKLIEHAKHWAYYGGKAYYGGMAACLY